MSALLSSDALRVLRETFGDAPIEEVTAVHGGRSGARLFGVRIGGEDLVVRVPDSAREQHAERTKREVGCMALAADRRIGPRLRYADATTGITVSVRIANILVGAERVRAKGRFERIATTLRSLHDGPPLPGDGDLMAMLAHFQGVIGERPAVGMLLRATCEAAEACRRFGKRTPCHNDLNPGNVLETADNVYLIDWEVAGWGDPFVDVAQVGVFGSSTPETREALLAAYLGHAPDARERAHAVLARVTALGVYAIGFHAVAALGNEGAPEDVTPRPLSDLLPELAQGRATSRDVAASLRQLTLEEAATDAYARALTTAVVPS
jgi:hypothetical protein